MADDDLAGKLRGVMHGAEPALSDGELATLEEAKDRLAETDSKSDRNSEPGDEVSNPVSTRGGNPGPELVATGKMSV